MGLKELLNQNFDMIIMNPPYNQSEDILSIVSDLVTKGTVKEVVSLQPIRFLQDSVQESRNNKKVLNLKNKIKNITEDIEVVGKQEANEAFGIKLNYDLGIIKLSKKAKFDIYSLQNQIIKLHCKGHGLWIEQYNGTQKNFVPFRSLISGETCKGSSDIRDLRLVYGYFVNEKSRMPKYKGLKFQEAIDSNQHSTATATKQICVSFKTGKEAKNFYDFLGLKSFNYFSACLCKDIHVLTKFLPFPKDFREPWTDEKYYDFLIVSKAEKMVIESWIRKNYLKGD